MSIEFYFRIVGMVVFGILGLYAGVEYAQFVGMPLELPAVLVSLGGLLVGLILGVLLGGALVFWFSIYGFTMPGMEEMAGKFNLPDRVYMEVTALGLLFGPTVVLIASVLASFYPVAKLYWLEPVAAMRAA